MKVAIASSGLGHVARGIETWALDMAAALHRRDIDVTLFGGAPFDREHDLRYVVLPCRRRSEPYVIALGRFMPSPFWRWGWKDAYGIEQFSFWLKLWPHLRRECYDILHVQDPMVAFWCNRFCRMGLIKTRVILAHGTEEPAEFLRQFEYVQHLAPWHLEEARAGRGKGEGARGKREAGRGKGEEGRGAGWVAIPNFVDTEKFHPVAGVEEKTTLRRRLGLPPESLVIGCVAAVKKHHKRIDYLIREFASFCDSYSSSQTPPFLLIAGARCDDSAELAQLAERLVPGRFQIRLDLTRTEMPDLYRAMDVFVLPSLLEMMPIALIEAMSSGLPVIVNEHPVLRWIAGDGGLCPNLEGAGALAAAMRQACDVEWRSLAGNKGLQRVQELFAEQPVVDRIIDMYRNVLGNDGPVVM